MMFCLRADSQEAFAHWELFEGTFLLTLRYIKHVVGTAFKFYAGEIMRQIIIRQASLAIISA